jgi:hypothetical protein
MSVENTLTTAGALVGKVNGDINIALARRKIAPGELMLWAQALISAAEILEEENSMPKRLVSKRSSAAMRSAK